MEKEIETKNDFWDDGYWAVILIMLIFGFAPFGGTDHAIREDVAELKGKVSVLEKVVLSDRGK